VARQLFAVTEGFFGPLFFVWLGAGLDLRDLVHHPSMGVLGICLGLGAVLAHLVGMLLRQPAPYALLASAQLGVPVAAATVGRELGVLEPGEGSALVLGALIVLAATVAGGSLAARTAPSQTADTS
jgi:Kef-type K+ transport system membrane component KefB